MNVEQFYLLCSTVHISGNPKKENTDARLCMWYNTTYGFFYSKQHRAGIDLF